MARSQTNSNPVRVRFDEFELDEANAWLLRSGKAVALAPTPFNLLCALARQPGMLLDFVKRDLSAGIRQGQFTRMPIALALNIVTGAVLGATHCMLEPGCESDFAEQSAAAALRGLGLDAKSAERIACSPLKPVQILAEGLLIETSGSPAPAVVKTTRNGVGRRKLS